MPSLCTEVGLPGRPCAAQLTRISQNIFAFVPENEEQSLEKVFFGSL
jgi:hypothetical protein